MPRNRPSDAEIADLIANQRTGPYCRAGSIVERVENALNYAQLDRDELRGYVGVSESTLKTTLQRLQAQGRITSERNTADYGNLDSDVVRRTRYRGTRMEIDNGEA